MWKTDSLVEMSGLCGISLDFKKAFDRVPWEHVFAIGRAAGFPSQILTPSRACMVTSNVILGLVA